MADHDALHVKRICAAGVVCLLPQDHPLAGKPVFDIQDIAEHQVTYDLTDKLCGEVDRLLAALPRPPILGIEGGQPITAIRLVQARAGIALAEPFYFAAMQPAGLVVTPLCRARNWVVGARGNVVGSLRRSGGTKRGLCNERATATLAHRIF